MIGNIVIVYTINLLGMMSPGPDLFIIVKNSLQDRATFRKGVFTSLGIALGCIFHVSFAVFGVASLLLYVTEIFWILKIGGALYLFYLGAMSIYSTFLTEKEEILGTSSGLEKTSSYDKGDERIKGKEIRKAFTEGFLCNILNVKAIIFFVSIFSQIIGEQRSFWLNLNYVVGIPLMAFIWFSLLARLLTVPAFQTYFKRYQALLGRVMGILLIVLAGVSLFAKI